jgi:hypothetical protein
MEETPKYPVTLAIDYPDRPLNKLTTGLRIFTIIPIFLVLCFLANNSGMVFLPLVLLVLFQQKYPAWWFDWNLKLTKFSSRVLAYFLLMRDEYPSTDQEQAVRIDIPYPDAKKDLNRWLPLIKWFLAIPHYIILFFLWLVALVCALISWFAILFTGRYPKDLFEFVVGVFRWSLRVGAYAFLLTTDRYPPFRLSE